MALLRMTANNSVALNFQSKFATHACLCLFVCFLQLLGLGSKLDGSAATTGRLPTNHSLKHSPTLVYCFSRV